MIWNNVTIFFSLISILAIILLFKHPFNNEKINREKYAYLFFLPIIFYVILLYSAFYPNLKPSKSLSLELFVLLSSIPVAFPNIFLWIISIRRARDAGINPLTAFLLYLIFSIFYGIVLLFLKSSSQQNSLTKKSKFFSLIEPVADFDDENIYKIISEEFENNTINNALWLKAEVKVNGEQSKIKSAYIKLRYHSLISEKKISDNREAIIEKNKLEYENLMNKQKEKVKKINEKKEKKRNRRALILWMIIMAFVVLFIMIAND